MDKVNTIPEQHYLSIVFLGAIIVFRSSSLQIAARSVISLAILLILWQILLFLRVWIPSVPFIVFSSFTAVAVGTITAELLTLIPVLGMTAEKGMLPEQLYPLFCVPLLAFQAEHRVTEVRQQVIKAFFTFAGVILLFASLREMLGSGKLFGIRIMPELFTGMTVFSHASGAAFMLAGIIILVQWICRRNGREDLVFTNPERENSSGDVPYLKTVLEKTYLRASLLFLGATLLSGTYPLVMHVLVGVSDKTLLYLLPATALIQGVMIGLTVLFSRSLRASFLNMYLRSIIIPTQTMVLLLPFYFPKIKNILPDRFDFSLIYYFAYLVVGCFFVCMTMLFIRTARRRLIFGRRPLFVDGLPLSFILLGICLIVISGVVSIVPGGMFEMTVL
jgi:hypothetical protein